MKKIAHCSLLIAFIPSVVLAADLYVQSIRAPIMSAPSLGSQVIAEAHKSDLLKEVEKQGNWHRVSYKDKTGWVSKLLVGLKPPMGKVSLLEETEEKLSTGARKRASAFTTAAAARGLAEDRARVNDKFKVDHYGVESMEAVKISDDEALVFLQQGVGR